MRRFVTGAVGCAVHCFFLVVNCPAQGVITTVAGSAWTFRGAGGPAINAPLGRVPGVAVDAAGNVYAPDPGNSIVVRVAPSGLLSVVAGNGSTGFSGEGGSATGASLFTPLGVALDASGNLYIADANNQRIRKVSPNGMITTVAGSGCNNLLPECALGDGGPATSAALFFPNGVAVDGAGNLFIADTLHNRVRKVNPSGIITTLAGVGAPGPPIASQGSGDGGPATSAFLASPTGVALDSAGNLYVAESRGIRKVDRNGIIATVAGPGREGTLGDGGPATSGFLNYPSGVTVDPAGNLYIADSLNYRIRKVSSAGTITTVAGNGTPGFAGDGGPAGAASLYLPNGVAVNAAGDLYIADDGNGRIRKIATSGVITTVAGNGSFKFGGDGGPATSASLYDPRDVAVDTAGNIFFAAGGRIRKVNPDGTISTVVGTGIGLIFGGPGTGGSLVPTSVAVDGVGNLYLAENYYHRVRKVRPGGTITTIAGSGNPGFAGDGGPAVNALLSSPWGLAVDDAGNLFIADPGNLRVRKVDAAGIITTIAGTSCGPTTVPSPCGPLGDGGPAIEASLRGPTSVAVDPSGNLYVGDAFGSRVRRVSPTGTITTVAGNGAVGYSGDGGPAANASFQILAGLAIDGAGNLFIADFGNGRVRKVDPWGTITTVAGNGCPATTAPCSLGDGGPATSASLVPRGLAADAAGNLYIADSYNERIRKVSPPLPLLPPNSVVNGASFRPAMQAGAAPAPGSIVAVFGADLSFTTRAAASIPLPTMLGDTSVTFNNLAAPLFFVSGRQLIAQIPTELPEGTISVQVTRGGLVSTRQSLSLAPVSPGIFTSNQQGTGQGAILDAQWRLVDGRAPAAAGEAVAVFCTGLGRTETGAPTGRPAPLHEPLARVLTPVTASVGGQTARVLFAGLAPGFVGVYQVNVEIPTGLSPSSNVPLVLRQNGATSNMVTLAVR